MKRARPTPPGKMVTSMINGLPVSSCPGATWKKFASGFRRPRSYEMMTWDAVAHADARPLVRGSIPY